MPAPLLTACKNRKYDRRNHISTVHLRTKVASAFYLQNSEFWHVSHSVDFPNWKQYTSRSTDGITFYRDILHGERFDGEFIFPEPESVVQEPWDQAAREMGLVC